MPKTTILTVCLILSFVIHYVAIWSIPDPRKKFDPTVQIELAEKEKPQEPAKEEIPKEEEKKEHPQLDQAKLESLLEHERKQSLLDQASMQKEREKIQKEVAEKLKQPGGSEKAEKILSAYREKYNPLRGKKDFKGFSEENGEMKETCAETNSYAGVGAEFDSAERVVSNNQHVKEIIQNRIDNILYVKIRSVKPKSPLDRAGVKPGDFIEARVQDVMIKPLGSPITVAVISNNQKKIVQLKSEVICFH